MGTAEGDAVRGELIRHIAVVLDDLVSRAERARPGRSGAEAEWLDRLLAELRPMAEQAHDLEVTRTIRDIVARHGSGPWPAEDVAAIVDADPAAVRRILDALTAAGPAWPGSGETGR
ncbi:hypothetical protein [Nocardia sp. NPDC051463]|uniref:hypothetical protein n=1 Tax=Nocardia sp. NPDC051463 TaxID=3154845 RepID=UPI00342C3F3D